MAITFYMTIKYRLPKNSYFLFFVSFLLCSENAFSLWTYKCDTFFIALYNTLYGVPLCELEQQDKRHPNHITKKMKIDEMKAFANTTKDIHKKTECPPKLTEKVPDGLILKTPFGALKNDTNEHKEFKKEAWKELIGGVSANSDHDIERVMGLFLNIISMQSKEDNDPLLVVVAKYKCRDCDLQKVTTYVKIKQDFPQRTYHVSIATRLSKTAAAFENHSKLQEKLDAIRANFNK